jgi:4-hydroxybutyrate CoA-transferase
MQRLNDLSQIASRLPPCPTLVLHSACAEPSRLTACLASDAERFVGAQVYCLMPMGAAPYAHLPASGHLRVRTFFPGKGLRAAVTEGRAQLLRHPLSAIPTLFDAGEIRVDAVFLQVTPPDEHGRVSLGISVDYMKAVLRQKPLVVAQINPRMPRTCGDTEIDADLIDYYVESEEGPEALLAVPPDETDRRIATQVAALIEDGAVLQVGIGALPDLVLACLLDRRHLGIHSGIITDAVRPLMERGVIDNSTKARFRGVSVTTMAAGSTSFYDFLNANSEIEFHPCSLTHARQTLIGIEGLTAINSALQIDLAGQVNAESVAGRVVAAPGGLPDFVSGAHCAPRGRSIIALRSRFWDQSNILAKLPAAAPVSVGGEHIDYVVTEFGVARLRGLNSVRRAEALIGVAHPEHRAALERELAYSRLPEA